MKKILALIMVAAMVCTSMALVIPASASAVGVNKATYAVPADAESVKTDPETGISSVSVGEKATLSWKGLKKSNISSGKLDLEPIGWGKETKGSSYVELAFEVKEAGEYEVIISYTGTSKANGNSTKYNEDLIVNGGDAQALDLGDDPTQGATVSVKVKLNEGKNTVRLSNPDAPTEKYHYNYYIKLLSIAVKGEGVYADKVDFVEPLAAYDFTGGKLADQTGKQAAIVLDDEPVDENGNETRTDDERKSLESHSARATAGENGITMKNGFFKLPENMFSKASEVTGITVSLTYTKEADYGWGSTWSEHLFAFSDKWITDELKNPDGSMNYADRADSFFATRNGNVGTSKTPYGADGSWMDGSLGEDYAKDGAFSTITVTFDPKTNVACIYRDGKLVKSSADNADVKAVLTTDMIKNFKYGVVGLPVGGDWGMWGFMTVKDLTIYTSALSAEQVGVLYEGGYEALLDGDHNMDKITDNEDGTHTISCTNEGCTYSVTEKCKSSNTDCEKESRCDTCNSLVKAAGEHIVDKYTVDGKTGMHVGTCTSCGKEVSHAPHAGAKTDCTKPDVCDVDGCGLEIKAGNKAHGFGAWKTDEKKHSRSCENDGCTVTEEGEHTFTNGVCTVCGYKDPNYKAPSSGTTPGGTTSGGSTAQPGKTGDAGVALWVALAVVSMAGVGVTVASKKRH